MSSHPVRLLGFAPVILFVFLSGCCVRQQNAGPVYKYAHPAYYTENFSKLPAEQRKAIRDLFLEEYYLMPVTPIAKGYTLDEYSIAIWRKAKQRRLLPDNDTEDWTGFFIVYNYGMWRDIFETLKENPHYLSDKGRTALCHYVTHLQYCNDGKPTQDYFSDEKLRELNIYRHPSRYSPWGIYSVRRRSR